jgi:hypothetical protein
MRPLIAAVLGALALATPAIAEPGVTWLYPETIPGAGLNGVAAASYTIVRQAAGRGLVGSTAFTLTTSRVAYGQFHSLHVGTVQFGLNAVKLRGTGLANGRRVSFTAIGVHNAMPGVDVFRVTWNHGAALGGVVTSGSIFIR